MTLTVQPPGWTFRLHRAIVATHNSFFQAVTATRWDVANEARCTLILPDVLPSDGNAWEFADMQKLLEMLYVDAPMAAPVPPRDATQLKAWLRVEALARYLMCERAARDVSHWLVGRWPDQLLNEGPVESAVAYAQILSHALAESSDLVPTRGDQLVQLSAWVRSALASMLETPAAAAAMGIRMPTVDTDGTFLALDDRPTMMACRDCSARGLDAPPASPMYLVQRRPSDGYPSALSIGCATVDYATLDQTTGYAQYAFAPSRPFTSIPLPLVHEPCCYTGKCPHCLQQRPLRIHWLRSRTQVR